MSLPASVNEIVEVQLTGGTVKVTGLTMRQVRECRAMEENAADIRAISYGALLPEPEVAEWFATALPRDVQAIISAIMRLSSGDEGATFPGGTGNDAVVVQAP